MFVLHDQSLNQVHSSVFKTFCISDLPKLKIFKIKIPPKKQQIKSSKSALSKISWATPRTSEVQNRNATLHSKKKVQNTHEHHPFMYSYTLFVSPFMDAKFAITAYPAPGAEVVNFFCQGSRPKYDSPKGWTFEYPTKQNRWRLKWVFDECCTKCDENTFKNRTSHYLTKLMICTLQEQIAISNATFSPKHPKHIGEFDSKTIPTPPNVQWTCSD